MNRIWIYKRTHSTMSVRIAQQCSNTKSISTILPPWVKPTRFDYQHNKHTHNYARIPSPSLGPQYPHSMLFKSWTATFFLQIHWTEKENIFPFPHQCSNSTSISFSVALHFTFPPNWLYHYFIGSLPKQILSSTTNNTHIIFNIELNECVTNSARQAVDQFESNWEIAHALRYHNDCCVRSTVHFTNATLNVYAGNTKCVCHLLSAMTHDYFHKMKFNWDNPIIIVG